MKLKNKKTGEIGYPYFQNWKEITCVIVDENAIQIAEYTSLAKLNEEWEDVPEESVEPYWFINDLDGEPMKCDLKNCGKSNFIEWGKHRKEIGNYFETKEEAEKAVERLKKLQNLKNRGYNIDKYIDMIIERGEE